MAIEDIYIETWQTEFARVYEQAECKLRKAVYVKTAAKEYTHFPKIGTGEATDIDTVIDRHADLVPTNRDITEVAVRATPARDVEWFDENDLDITNVDFRAGYSESISGALNRKQDARIITALGSSTNVTATSGTAVTSAKIIGLSKELTVNKVPLDGNRWLVLSPGGMEDMLNDDKLTSRDYVQEGILKDGFVKGVLGFNIIVLEDMSMLPLVSGQTTRRYGFAFHSKAVGFAVAREPILDVTYRNDKDMWQVLGKVTCGAGLILPTGVIKVAIDD